MIRARGGLLQQRQHVLRDGEDAEEVGVVGRSQRLHRQLRRFRARGKLDPTPALFTRTSSRPYLSHPPGGGLRAGRVGDIENHALGVQPFAAEPVGGLLAFFSSRAARIHGEPVLSQLPADLETDPLVRPRHRRIRTAP